MKIAARIGSAEEVVGAEMIAATLVRLLPLRR
jgi:hypothetical protein